jgi:hypothetical protein
MQAYSKRADSPMQWKSWLQAVAIAALMAGIFIADTVTDL